MSARRLSESHREQLRRSAITDDVIDERGYFTVERASDLEPLGFSSGLHYAPTLVVPIHGVVKDEPPWFMHRPDATPVMDGKARKYLIPKRQRMTLDVHPRSLAGLGDPGCALVVTEGSKKVDALVTAGARAVLGVAGVWNWRGTNEHGGTTALGDWESVALNDRKVYVVYDSDVTLKKPVMLAMERLGAFLVSRGASVRYVYLPAGPGGEKVGADDYLAQGHTLRELRALATPTLRTATVVEESSTLIPFTEIKAVPIRWAWRHRVALGKITALSGRPKIGKGLLYSDLIASVTRASLDGDLAGPRHAILVTTEDEPGDTLKPRLIAAGADLSRVSIFQMGSKDDPVPFRVPQDADELRRRVEETDAALVVVDPLVEFIEGKVDSHKSHPVRQALAAVRSIVSDRDCAMLVVFHLNKGTSTDPLLRNEGSAAFTQVVRGGLMLGDDPDGEDGDQRALAVSSTNLAPKVSSLVYRIETTIVDGDTGGPIETAQMVLVGESDADGHDLLRGRPDEEEQSGTDEAEALLSEELADGPRPVQEIMKQARQLGVSDKQLRRARGRLEVKANKTGFEGGWELSLPTTPSRRRPTNLREEGRLGRLRDQGRDSDASQGAQDAEGAPPGEVASSRPTVRPGQVYTGEPYSGWRLRVVDRRDGQVRVRVESNDGAAGRQFDEPVEHFGTRLRRVR